MSDQETFKQIAWLDLMVKITMSLIDAYKDDDDWVKEYKPKNLSNIDAWLEERLRLMKQNTSGQRAGSSAD